jgi:tetratricopeptide (TPR) repeat protein
MADQLVCLDDKLRRFAGITSLLEQADPTIVETAVESVQALRPVSECAEDTERTVARALDPEDPEVLEIELALVRVDASIRAGALADAQALARGVITDAEAIDAPTLVARGELALGRALAVARNSSDAVESLRAAANHAEALGDDETVLRAEVELLRVHGQDRQEFERADQEIERALSKAARMRVPPALEAALWRNIGLVRAHERRFLEAHEALDRARSLVVPVWGEDSLHMTGVLNAAGLVAWAERDYESAEAIHRKSIEILVPAVGEEHPWVAGELANLAAIEHQRGNFMAAIADQQRALAILRKSVDSRHPLVSQALNNLAAALVTARRFEEALGLLAESVELKRATMEPDDPSLASSLGNYAATLSHMGRHEQALDAHREALAIREKKLGRTHPETALSLANLGLALHGLGRDAEAREHIVAALESLEKEGGGRSPRIVEPLRSLGLVDVALGQKDAGIETLERALSIALAPESSLDPLDVAEVEVALAEALRERDRARARALAESALQRYTTDGRDPGRKAELAAIAEGMAR